MPADTALSGGTATLSVYFFNATPPSSTNYVITASDVTTPSILSSTSAPVTIYP